MKQPKIQLETCWTWKCSCGHRNYESGEKPDIPEDEKRAIAEAMGAGPHELGEIGGQLICAPCNVTCLECETTYVTDIEGVED